MTREEIIEIFKKCGAMLEGHFLLTSGRHSDSYLQCALVLQYPDQAEKLAKELVNSLPKQSIDLVVGPAIGGITIAYEVARQLGTPAIFAERENDSMTLRRGFQIPAGAKVLVVEDVITTGGSVMEVAALVEELGGEVVGIASIVNSSNGKVELGYPYYSILPLEVISYLAEECPLCQKGIPVVKPGSRKVIG